ncbi:cytochrome p450 [Colletotrichum incanum]|uniref:Cytochrome p450 n=1 Tax=Colletotrichum incanum TaxID=1573173 RepID=A0A162NM95_COLIC|nr:cytochrome p450 [Colletotrichum incanum]
MHTNVGVWGPSARSFNPDRWLAPNAQSLEQYQVAFSKGNRMCLGQNLATAEITIILAHFFRRYKMSLPDDFVPPRKVDVFTLEYEKPGILINVSVRE